MRSGNNLPGKSGSRGSMNIGFEVGRIFVHSLGILRPIRGSGGSWIMRLCISGFWSGWIRRRRGLSGRPGIHPRHKIGPEGLAFRP